MSNRTRLTWIGPVRLNSFKACAKALGRALGVPHCGSLEALARSCGWLSFSELNRCPDPRQGAGVSAMGSDEEIYELWCQQVVVSYGLRCRAELDAVEQLPKLFRYLRVPSAHKPSDVAARGQDEDGVPRTVRDPMLRVADWRDAEFRQWIGGVVARTMPKRRDVSDERGDAALDELKRLEEELE